MEVITGKAVVRQIGWALLSAAVAASLTLAGVLYWVPVTFTTSGTVLFPVQQRSPTDLSGLAAAAAALGRPAAGGDTNLSLYLTLLRSNRAQDAIAKRLEEPLRRLYPQLVSPLDQRHFVAKAITASWREDGVMALQATVSTQPVAASLLARLHHRRVSDDQPYRQLTVDLILAAVTEMDRAAVDIKLDRTRSSLDDAKAFYSKQLQVVARCRAELLQAQERAHILDAGASAAQATEALAQTQTKLRELDGQVVVETAALQGLRSEQARQLAALAELPIESPLLTEQRGRYTRAQAEFERVSTLYGPRSPQVLRAAQELRRAARDLASGVRGVKAGLMPDYVERRLSLESLKVQRTELQRAVAAQEARLGGVARASAEVGSRLQALQREQQALAALRAQVVQLDMDYWRHGLRWSFLDPPEVPDLRSAPRLGRMALLGLVFGALMGLTPLLRRLLPQLLQLNSAE